MDQKELRALEHRCIQEEPPPCTAACPIHIDVRGFTGKIAAGAWDEAWKILTRNMPLPNILARICDHPCESVCKRDETGGAIAVSELERACVTRVGKKVKPFMAPKKNVRVAVVGGGLSGLVAAWDLLLKGYQVAIFETSPHPGYAFRMFSDHILSKSVVDEEIATLQAMGADLHTHVSITQKGWLDQLSREFGAVYVSLDAETIPYVPVDTDGTLYVDPVTLATGTKGIFAGGRGLNRKPSSPILNAADGRKGVISIDRFLQNVSMTADRENEGPLTTRLQANLEGVKPEPVVQKSNAEGSYTNEEAVREAKRCIQCQCLKCVRNCLYLEHFKGYPKRYIREIYNNETIVIGSHGRANRLINWCTLCGLCGVVCPNGVSMADVCLEARRSLVRRGKMPPSAHDFALQDMAFNNGDHFALARHQPGMDRSRFIFFPGCQLSGSSPEHVERTYDYLRKHLSDGVGFMLRCCSAPAYWAGRDDLFQEGLGGLKKEWEAMGKPKMVLACPTCYMVLKNNLHEIEIISLWELLDEIGLPSIPHPPQPVTVALHDPCTSRSEQAMQGSVRRLLGRLGYTLKRIELEGDKTECCGYGGLMSAANPDLARDTAKRRADETVCDWVTYCAMCRDSLAVGGTPVAHILDLIFEGSEGWSAAQRKGPGYSERHENRSRLKEKMLSEVFGEGGRGMEPYERIVLHISPEVQGRMEKRRILAEDVQRVIDHAERTGNKIRSKKTKHWLASFRARTVTYWVEYMGMPDGYTVYNVYSHRMEIVGEYSL